MACPCCASRTCSGNVTFTMSNFSSVALSNGQPYLGADSPNGIYSGALQTVLNNVSCYTEAFGSQFTLGGTNTNADCRVPGTSVPVQPGPYNFTVLANFEHPVSGLCNNQSVVPPCGLRISAHGRRGAPTHECPGLFLQTGFSARFTIAQLAAGVSLTQSDFSIQSPLFFLSSYTLSFNFSMQLNPLP
jgi:hypothetical protein